MLAVVKIGGSVLTDKSKPYTLREDNLDILASKVRSLYYQKTQLILVHGGGSFGHPTAAKYSLSEGGLTAEKVFGFAETRYWMSYLNLRVIEKLLSVGVPATSVQTSTVASNENGSLKHLDSGRVKMLLERGIVPVLYGDAVVDTTWGFSILSGDDIALRLALELRADVLVYVMGSGGVYSAPPGRAGSTLLRELRPSRMPQIGEGGLDVTGGLRHKLDCAFEAARNGIRVAIGGLAYLEDMVFGKEAPYTRVLVE